MHYCGYNHTSNVNQYKFVAASTSFEELRIGEGIYTSKDIATILKIPIRKVSYWISKYVREKFPEITGYVYNFEQERGIYVNFKSLLQIYVFSELKVRGHSNKEILKMYSFISERYDTKYPFAKKSIYSVGSELMLEEKGELVNANFQISLKEILSEYIHKIEFDMQGNAIRFFPLGKEKSIVVDPQIQFGSPTIKGTRISAAVIYESFKAGDSQELIASVYDISVSDVHDAIEFTQAA